MLHNPDSDPSQILALAEAIIKHLPQDTSGMLGRIHDWAVAHPELCERLKIPEKVAITKISTSIWDHFFGANRKLMDAGHEPISTNDLNSISAETGAEFINESQFVEDPEMKELWASLLASYVLWTRQERATRKAFSSILGQLSPYDAKCLNEIYAVESSLRTSTARLPEEWVGKPGPPQGEDLYASRPISTVSLPEKAFEYKDSLKATTPEMNHQLGIDLLAALGNLCRLGLIEPHGYMNNGSDPRIVYHTGLGLSFASAINFNGES
jgi:hypothetical protein